MRARVPDDFDWKYYIEHNPDIVKRYNVVDEYSALKHWKIRGYKEGRVYREQVIHIEGDSKVEGYTRTVPLLPGKITVYTAISGGYDTLKEVKSLERDIEYICFTNQEIQSKTWKVKPTPAYLLDLSPVKMVRCIKILPHHFLSSGEISVWVDGNIEVVGNIREFVSIVLEGDMEYATSYHPDRTCIYVEAEAVVKFGKESQEVVDTQIREYKKKGFPVNYGLVQSGIIVRRHGTEECKKFGREWWEEILTKSKRDQLSFNYVLWKNPDLKLHLFNPNHLVSKYFQIWSHKGTSPTRLPEDYGTKQNYLRGKEIL